MGKKALFWKQKRKGYKIDKKWSKIIDEHSIPNFKKHIKSEGAYDISVREPFNLRTSNKKSRVKKRR